jgi:DNA-binding transcriptional regulator GbsR (MarR family)
MLATNGRKTSKTDCGAWAQLGETTLTPENRMLFTFQKFLKVPNVMSLPPLIQNFVLHFGEMGGRWGVNRTVGQIYALLFVSDRPLNAEEIAEALGMSRSNVSMGLKELDGWRLVRKRHLPGDRREFFSAPDDIWQIVRTLAEERRRREVDPTLTLLRDILLEEAVTAEERHAQTKMREMHDMIELLTSWSDDVQKLDNGSLMRLLALGAGVSRILDLKNKVTIFRGKSARSNDEGAA